MLSCQKSSFFWSALNHKFNSFMSLDCDRADNVCCAIFHLFRISRPTLVWNAYGTGTVLECELKVPKMEAIKIVPAIWIMRTSIMRIFSFQLDVCTFFVAHSVLMVVRVASDYLASQLLLRFFA